jgi:hypothetical protein
MEAVISRQNSTGNQYCWAPRPKLAKFDRQSILLGSTLHAVSLGNQDCPAINIAG